jgi:tetratricopeptide (TPR) repeat protein
MTRPSSWRVLVPAAVVLALAGTAAARRDRKARCDDRSTRPASLPAGRENERKPYNREAMADYAEALAHDPEFVMATVRLARSVAGRDRGRAKSLLSCAAERRDGVTARERLLFDIASAQVNQKELKEIVALVDQYRREYPDDPEGYELRANYFLRQGKADEAARESELLLERNPNYAIAYNHLGYNAMQQGVRPGRGLPEALPVLAPDQANLGTTPLGEPYANTAA